MKLLMASPSGAAHPVDNVTEVSPATIQADEALRRVTQSQPLPDDWYTTAARAEHNRHCADCRERTAASDAAVAANGASMQRRDRIQLGLNIGTSRRAVNV